MREILKYVGGDVCSSASLVLVLFPAPLISSRHVIAAHTKYTAYGNSDGTQRTVTVLMELTLHGISESQ